MKRLSEDLRAYRDAGIKVKGLANRYGVYVGTLNDGLYYWSSLKDLDTLAFVSRDRFGKEVVETPLI